MTTTRGRSRPGFAARTARGQGKRIGRAWGRATRRHPWLNLFLSIVLSVIAVLALVLGSVLQSVLYYLVMALAGLGALAIRRAQQMDSARQANPPKTAPRQPRPEPTPPPGKARPTAAAGPVTCTDTGKVAKECDCASRHVETEKGVRQFGRPIGSPIGRRKKANAS